MFDLGLNKAVLSRLEPDKADPTRPLDWRPVPAFINALLLQRVAAVGPPGCTASTPCAITVPRPLPPHDTTSRPRKGPSPSNAPAGGLSVST